MHFFQEKLDHWRWRDLFQSVSALCFCAWTHFVWVLMQTPSSSSDWFTFQRLVTDWLTHLITKRSGQQAIGTAKLCTWHDHRRVIYFLWHHTDSTVEKKVHLAQSEAWEKKPGLYDLPQWQLNEFEVRGSEFSCGEREEILGAKLFHWYSQTSLKAELKQNVLSFNTICFPLFTLDNRSQWQKV